METANLMARVQELETLLAGLKAENEKLHALFDESNEHFKLAIECSPIAIFIQTNACFSYVNQATLKLYEVNSPDELLGTKVIERIHPDYTEVVNERIHKLNVEKEATIDLEYFQITTTGKLIEVEVSAIPMTYNGQVSALVFVKDISQRKRDERRVKHREELLRYIIEHNRSAVAVHDRDLKYVYVSQKYLEDYQVKEKDIIGKHHYDVFPDFPQKWRDVHQLALRGIVSSAEDDLYTRADGSKMWTRWECRPWYKEDDSIGGIIVYTEVITERKLMELELRASRDKAEKSDQLKSSFLQNMSHEIRTPLTGIMGFSQLVAEQKDLDPESRSHYCELIHESGKRLQHVVEDVLKLSSIDSGSETVRYNLINVKEFMSSLEMTFKNQFNHEKIIYQTVCLRELIISCDEQKLYQIFTNLIQNALKFTEQGKIIVGCKNIDKGIRFFVTDTGIGLRKEHQELIFKRFYQVKQGGEKGKAGSGLGLSIVKGYVELLGGHIWCESNFGEGTTFYFDIPVEILEKSQLPDNQEASKSELLRSDTPLHFLVAEDEYTNFYFLKVLLGKKKYEVTHVENGEAAIQAFESGKKFDFILMDLKMPVVDGIEATRRIKAINPAQRIIAQSAYTTPEYIKLAMEAGCDAYVEKPIDPLKLFATIEDLSDKN